MTVVVFGLLALGCAAAWFLHYEVSRRGRLRLAQAIERAAADLAPALESGEWLVSEARRAVRRHGRPAVGEVLRQSARELEGTILHSISVALEEIRETDRRPAPSQARGWRARLRAALALELHAGKPAPHA